MDYYLFVFGEPTQLHRIVMNLCTNAIHAVGEHGRLRLNVGEVLLQAQR
jgi:signal transduction histidine kinase